MAAMLRTLLVAVAASLTTAAAVSAQIPELPGLGGSAASTEQQTSEGEQQAQPQEGPPPVPGIPEQGAGVADLAATLERAIVQVRGARSVAQTDPAVARVAQGLDRVRAALAAMEDDLDETALEQLARRDLLDVRRRWQREQRRLDDWFETLAARGRRLDREASDLRALHQAWSAVASERRDTLPPTMQTRIQGVLEQIARNESTVEGRLDAVLDLMASISDFRLEVRDAMDRIDRARPTAGAELLRREAPPLWNVRSQFEALPDLGRQLVDSVRQNVANLAEFGRDRSTGFVLALLGFVAVAIVFVVARRRNPPREDADPRTALAIRLLQRPLSATLLIVLTAVLWSFPDAPSAFYDAVLVGMLVPVLRLLPLALSRSRRVLLYSLVGLWAVERLARLVTQFSLTERLVMLAISAAAFAGLAWAMRPSGSLKRALTGGWGAATWFLGRVWLVVLAGAVAANVLGAVDLAAVLGGAALNGLYFAMVLLGAVLAIESLTTLAIRSERLQRVGIVKRNGGRIAGTIARAARLLAVTLWGVALLFLFRIWQPLTGALGAALSATWAIGSFQLSLGKVLAFFTALIVAVLVSRFVRFVLEDEVLTRLRLPRGVPETISMLVHYGLVTIGVLVALGVAGFELTQFAIVLGALSVGIGFGLQNVVNNFVSGLILVFERPISVGDTIEIGTLLGTVRGIGIRASTIRTFDGAEVIVPNGSLLSSELVNWTLSDYQRRLVIPVGVAYGSDVERAREALVAAASSHGSILSHPTPVALFQGFGDSSLDFEVRAWTDDFQNWPQVRSELVTAIEAGLRDAGVEIPFPQRDLHVRSMPAAREEEAE